MLLEFFPIFDQRMAMSQDSDKFSHPISFDVNHASDIRRIFDPIAYSKGAAIIRMINSFLGEEAFREGLEAYLKRHQYSNAVQDDLWNTWTKSGHKHDTLPKELDIKTIMDTFTLQAGYPVLQVHKNETNFILTQSRYKLPSNDPNDTSKWFIPITFSTKNIPQSEIPKKWFRNDETSLELNGIVEDKEWIYFNVNRSGHYRVNYDKELWSVLIHNFNALPPITKAQLVDDAFWLSRAEYMDYEVPITFLYVMTKIPHDYLSWAAAEAGLTYITQMLRREPAFEQYRAVMKAMLKPVFEEIGFTEGETDTDLELTHRARMLKLICDFKFDRCTWQAQQIYRNWIQNPTDNK